jgi:3-oxoacyl-[acyl-carrier-protein] synthase I
MEGRKVYISDDNVITSLGFGTDEVIRNIRRDCTGIRTISDTLLYPAPVSLSTVDTSRLDELFLKTVARFHPGGSEQTFTRMEKLLILSVGDVVKDKPEEFFGHDTLLVISSTKGNIDLLEKEKKDLFEPDRIKLWKLAEVIRSFFGFKNPPVILSNACVSGVLALSVASRMISEGSCVNVVVTGGDIISEFVVSGFASFQAMSQEPCRPFDSARNGLSLGEGCGSIILTSGPHDLKTPGIIVAGAASSNDANHISGPSRTGEELALAINNALKEASMKPGDISYISAHGTATLYNDEMESKALALSGLRDIPVNSFKGYWGHTLGGAGIIESVIAARSAADNFLFRSAGFSSPGVPESINIIREHTPAPVDNVLKTASGFGGCNAAIIFKKEK